MSVEAPVAVEVDEATSEVELDLELSDLVDQYLEDDQSPEDRDHYMAAFEAGTLLKTVEPLELYDAIDDAFVRVQRGQILTVASHEGDVLVGTLTDNSHSLGVLYEEEHRWYQRKYFLPLGLLTNREKIEINPEIEEGEPLASAPLKGARLEGKDRRTEVAVRRIEDMALQDEVAFLPRGVTLIFRKGVTATDPISGDTVTLGPGTEAEVTRAVGDILNDTEIPPVQIQVGERNLTVPFEIIADLDPDEDVLTLDNIYRRREAEISRRTAVRRLTGIGIGLALLGTDAGVYFVRREANPRTAYAPQLTLDEDTSAEQARLNHQIAAAIVPQAAAIYGYFSSGNQYWWQLRGAMMNLREKNCGPVVAELEQVFQPLSAASSSLSSIYARVFHRRVHTGWSEIRHYRTDKDGRRHYSHSTWIKNYSTMWVEPSGLTGFHSTVESWSSADGHYYRRASKLRSHPLFDILAADPEHPERTFEMQKSVVGFGRDAAISMTTMALLTLPPAFYDEIVTLASERGHPNDTPVGPRRGFYPYQKESVLVAGLATGVVLARRYQKRLNRKMAENKYQLGQSLESEIRRVPGLDHDEAFSEYFRQQRPAQLVSGIDDRATKLRRVGSKLRGFRYTYGSGWSHGRPLDSIYVDPAPLQRALPQIIPQFPRYARALERFFTNAGNRERLLPVMQNAIGTETVEARIKHDAGEASGASWKRSLWFAAPLWGAVAIDAFIKNLR